MEIVPVTIPADEATIASRADTVHRMAELGQIEDPESGELNHEMTGWLARINGAEFPVYAFGVEQAADGTPMLSLAFVPDSLQIGESPVSGAPTVEAKQSPSSWGAPGKPDPREGIAGWAPASLGEQVAGNAVRAAEASA
ncbi:hypothetical protein ACWKSP_26560 [Micromonosporaceae bacterium Da 78-11]